MSDRPGWHTSRLDELCDINPPKPKLHNVDDSTEVLFVPMAAVNEVSGTVATPQKSTVGIVGRKSYRSFTSGDVLFAKITPCMENGKAAVVPTIPTGLGFGSTEFHVIRPKQGTDPRLIWHFVRQQSFRDEAANHFTGTVGQLRVPADFLKSFEVMIPSDKKYQSQLAALLDAATGHSASASSHLATARRAVERFRQSVLAAACSGRLTADWREEHPEAESTAPEKTSGKTRRTREMTPLDLELPEMPDTYIVSTVGAASTVLEYGTSKKADNDALGVPVLRMGNIQRGRLEFDDLKYCPSDREIERLVLRDGDLLFNRTNSPELVGKAAVFHEPVAMTFASYLIRVRFADDVADPDFVNYWLNSAWGRMWARHVKTDGVSQSNINGTKLGCMPLPLPPIEEQREIVRRASHMLAMADALLARIDETSRSVDRSSQALLAKTFRGELVGSGDNS
ncbi:type I restriction modification system, specificity subunit [Mycolicibacterium fortuitum subsp. acetamidolyticum]|uniref:Type I restriction modification system, specificity subunit n=1 Tax=Mycolicibacterium fortuitum subsp. acetamidolyticum TaxID=144550 RepID=A0A124E4B5_MYCFO|nr:restriction endonuclease subunit S [Mycolicibacterium fortuitum]MCV7137840.1 restriction endonuclease subunit S [Mycolicibacterium fortuitum]GAT02589.1 type I restriction modification system, specificity subunit [Mycolicibacterium fortuitum subsp. acetamidolyticum]